MRRDNEKDVLSSRRPNIAIADLYEDPALSTLADTPFVFDQTDRRGDAPRGRGLLAPKVKQAEGLELRGAHPVAFR